MIRFGYPTKYFNGETVSSGQAATRSSRLLNHAMSKTAHYFHKTRVTKSQVKAFFKMSYVRFLNLLKEESILIFKSGHRELYLANMRLILSVLVTVVNL